MNSNNKLLGKYKNGNYDVMIWENGTKLRYNKEDRFLPEFPESIDCKITNYCKGTNCVFCHENSGPNGKHANLNHPIFDSLPSFTELAIGGGNPLSHPMLDKFLERMAAQKVICNLTVHLNHFEQYYELIKYYVDNHLLYGIGISVNDNINEKQIKMIEDMPNAVVHVIAGVVRYSTLMKLANHNIKLLILGYKTFGRGEKYFDELSDTIRGNIDYMYKHMYELRDWFPLISFDNLAIEQLNVKELVSPDEWEKTYMGNDGQYTMYVDLVNNKFAVSSVSRRLPIGEETDIKKLFEVIKK